MDTSFAIGEFSRLTHLTVKTLRHYHDQGLLVPYAVDEFSGYRRYSTDQVPDALLIGRLRALDMPLADVRRVLDSPDTGVRDAVIADHLLRMEAALDRTRAIVTSLRGLLTPESSLEIERRTLPDQPAVTVTAVVEHDRIGAWCAQAFATLYANLRQPPAGPAGALYSTEFFTEGAGQVTAYVPVRSNETTIPGGPHAVAMHAGAYVEIDRTYAALGSHAATTETVADGPIREIYLIGPGETDEAGYRTEVCWPVLAGSGSGPFPRNLQNRTPDAT